MVSNKLTARLFGVFFILAFLSYGIGSGLVQSITDAPDTLANVYANKTQVIVGIILMALIHSFVNIGLPVLVLPILKPYNYRLVMGYLSAAIAATVVLVIGAIFLLMLLPLSDAYLVAGTSPAPHFETIAMVLVKGGFFSYQLGMAIWGLGGLLFCSVLYKSRLIPRFIPVWGVIGYIIFISGTLFELFGNPIGVQLSLPGGLFEIFLSLWLIVKGFNSSPVASETEV